MSEEFRMIAQDPRLHVEFGPETLVMKDGLQPYMLATSTGSLVVQAFTLEPPFKTRQKVYHRLIETVISRDGGKSWRKWTHTQGRDDVFIEGGATELSDGVIVALDTYFVPTDDPDIGVGEVWYSRDDWHTLEGPFEAKYEARNVDYDSGTDDAGADDRAGRLHRSIVELPDGDLLTISYCRIRGEYFETPYMPTQLKVQSFLLRSSDKGRTWRYVTSLSASADFGTEGPSEATLLRLSQGKYAGRLICLMRTGHEMVETHSDDEGATWSEFTIPTFGDVDIRKVDDWRERFWRQPIDTNYTSLIGSVVDPDLIELQNGVLACAFGVRISAHGCFYDSGHEWNGNYLAFSFDQGESWTHCVMLTSGIDTTHYMGVRELRPNVLYVVYDLGHFRSEEGRAIMGREAKLHFGGV